MFLRFNEDDYPFVKFDTYTAKKALFVPKVPQNLPPVSYVKLIGTWEHTFIIKDLTQKNLEHGLEHGQKLGTRG
jgi:hypothetical protein